MKKLLTRRLRFRTAAPTISIKKQGRVILNRPAASFFEDANFGRVLLYWDDETHTLTVQGTKEHPEQIEVYFGGPKNIPGAFSAKTPLQSIGYDFSANRTFVGKYLPEEAAIEFHIPPECFLPLNAHIPQRDHVTAVAGHRL